MGMALLCAFSTLVSILLVGSCSDVYSKNTVISIPAKAAV